MSAQVLVIGHEEILDRVMKVQLSTITLTYRPFPYHQEEIICSLPDDLDSYQAIWIVNPIELPKDWATQIENIPIFTLQLSELALYSALFSCCYQGNNAHLPISVDCKHTEVQTLQSELEQKRIHLIEYQESKRQHVYQHHLSLWRMKQVGAVVTSDPIIQEQLHRQHIPVSLIYPTEQCVEMSLRHIEEEMKHYQQNQPIKTIDKIRYENKETFHAVQGIGVSAKTLHRLQCLCYANGTNTFTAFDLAKGFSITLRSARRILSILEHHRIATVIGEVQLNKRGRPRTVFRIDLQHYQDEILSHCSESN